MKNVALMCTVAAVALFPMAAQAKTMEKKTTYTYTTTKTSTPFNYETPSANYMKMTAPDGTPATATFTLTNSDEQLMIDGQSVYLISDAGKKYMAPDGAYYTNEGLTVFSESGLLLRTESTTTRVMTYQEREEQMRTQGGNASYWEPSENRRSPYGE